MNAIYDCMNIYYSVSCGKDGGVEYYEWGDLSLYGEDAEKYTIACMTYTPIENMEHFDYIREIIYKEILKQELEYYRGLYELYDYSVDNDNTGENSSYAEDSVIDIQVKYGLIVPEYYDVIDFIQSCFKDGDVSVADDVISANAYYGARFKKDVYDAAMHAGCIDYVNIHREDADYTPEPVEIKLFIDSKEKRKKDKKQK